MASTSGEKRKSDAKGDDLKSKKIKYDEKEAGILLFAGLTDYNERRNSKLSSSALVKWSPHRISGLEDTRIRSVSSGCISTHFFAITEEGKVMAWGLNHKNQLGLGDDKYRGRPSLIDKLSGYNIIAVATGRYHSLFLTDEGRVFACGDNKSGQCGTGNKKEVSVSEPKQIDYQGHPVVAIACGADFSVILNEKGVLYSFGHPEYGQLGHNTDGKYIVVSGVSHYFEYSPTMIKLFVEKDPNNGMVNSLPRPCIKKIACGANHCVAVDDQNRTFTWGFGGYGRLGHSETKDEFVPRLMSGWQRITGAGGGVTNVVCGGQFNMAETTTKGAVYMWGQYKPGMKEANMYPRTVPDLTGWNIRHMACNQSGWVVCADDDVIASIPSPANGALGMGPMIKSSTAPKIVSTLKDVYVNQVGMGLFHTLYIVRADTPELKEKIESKFPLFDMENEE